MELLKVLSLYLAFLGLGCVAAFDFWDAQEANITIPSHIIIDTEQQLLIVAANNSVCHLSFDLKEQFNVQQTQPNINTANFCEFQLYQKREECQNYPHVLTFPTGTDTIFSPMNNTQIPVNQTVLICGSNAFDPICQYRDRSTLKAVSSNLRGMGFSPYQQYTGATSMWTSTGQLVAATPFDSFHHKFVITLSSKPFDGALSVSTLPSNQNWFYNTPTFVSIHEIGEYIYVFFQEEALEPPQNVLYSRVARVCKNDTGSLELAEGTNIFTTFLKARIRCSSGSGMSGDIPFHYNEIQDTYYVPADNATGNTEQIFAVFTSAKNGPVGSAVCTFTFGREPNDIGNVFNGNYHQQVSSSQWQEVNNFQPFTCEPGSRSVDHARDIQLMKPTVTSSNGPRPLLMSEEYSFKKIVVSQTRALDNKTYDILFIAATSTDNLVILKAYLPHGQQYEVIHTEVLGPNTQISQMKLNNQDGDGRIFIATDNGIYGVPVANCAVYTDCCSCIAARDPDCAYDTTSQMCSSVTSISEGLQDLSGNINICPNSCGPVTAPKPTSQTTESQATVTDEEQCGTKSTTDSEVTFGLDPPSIGGLSPVNTTTLMEHTWIIVGAVVGFVGGVLVGMIVTVFFFRKSNILYHAKHQRHQRRRRTLEQCGNERNFKSLNRRNHKNSGPATDTSKLDEYPLKNNNVKLNDYTPVHSVKSSPSVAAKFSTSLSQQASCAPIPVAPPITPPHKKTACVFSFENPQFQESVYDTLSASVKSDPNVKSSTKAEEPITNQQRAAYGRNILARTPSVDASKHSQYSRTTLPVVSPHLMYSTRHHDPETGSLC